MWAVSALIVALSSYGLAGQDRGASREYRVRGIVRGLLPDQKTVNIQHEEIPGFMAGMTMPFTLRNPKDYATLKVDDGISFRLTVTDKDSWIDELERIDPKDVEVSSAAAAPPAMLSPKSSTRLRPGDVVPDFTLTDQNGQTITRSTFSGKPLVLTFIFTRCPIANFCPLMNKNFAQLQDAIKAGPDSLHGARLLSISFDPNFDTPAVLREYAAKEQADQNIWKFATGPTSQTKELTSVFSVFIQPEAGTISHGLATALIDAKGRVVEIWRGNGWKADEVLAKLLEITSKPAS